MTSKHNDICYICGGKNPNSQDHIPPKNLFLKKYRNLDRGLITVPCHAKCNKKYELDDEYFRYCLCIPAYWTSALARELWGQKLKKQLHRPQSTGFLMYLSGLIEKAHILDKEGIPIVNAGVAFLDAQRMENVILRIARGLFYRQFNYRIPDEHPMELIWNQPQGALEIISEYGIGKLLGSVGGGIFRHFYFFNPKDEKSGIYFFIFFDSIYFTVHIGKH